MVTKYLQIGHLKGVDLAKYTTFRIGGPADVLYTPKSKGEAFEVVKNLDLSRDNPIIIGNGSNLLISSQGHRGAVILTSGMNKMQLLDDDTLLVESGVKGPVLSRFCAEHSLTGMEFLIGIPGTVGGFVCMNASANGQAIADTIVEVEVIDLQEKQVKRYSKDDLMLGYRTSKLNPQKELVTSAKFKLCKANKALVEAKMADIVNFRKSRQPKGFNVGSMFKNPRTPESVSSGFLLDQVGAKSWQEGGAQVTPLHANFINNICNATSLDVCRLLLKMHATVKLKTGYSLTPEVIYVGEPTEEEEKIWKILTQQ